MYQMDEIDRYLYIHIYIFLVLRNLTLSKTKQKDRSIRMPFTITFVLLHTIILSKMISMVTEMFTIKIKK